MFTRTGPAGGSGRQSMPAARSSRTYGSSLSDGRTAMVGTPAATAAREMLTPLPPACEVTDSARITAPRSSRDAKVTVRSMLGLGVSVTIMRPRPRRPGREAGHILVGDTGVGDQHVDVVELGEAHGVLVTDLRRVTEHDHPPC